MAASFVTLPQLFLALGETKSSNCVIVFVVQGFLVALQSRAIIFSLKVKVSYLDIFQCLVRIPGVELADIVSALGGFLLVRHGPLAIGMLLVIVFGRAQVDFGVAARALAGFGTTIGTRRGRIGRRFLRRPGVLPGFGAWHRILLGDGPPDQAKHQRKNKKQTSHEKHSTPNLQPSVASRPLR